MTTEDIFRYADAWPIIEAKSATALAVLENAVNRCMTEDVCTGEVSAALEYLATQTTLKWPFDQFRRALAESTRDGIEKEASRQVLDASLNGIRRALQRD